MYVFLAHIFPNTNKIENNLDILKKKQIYIL